MRALRAPRLRHATGGREGLLEVGLQVVDVLESDREAHQTRGDAGGELLLRGELRVRRGGGVDDERAHVADVGQVAEEAERVDELAPGLDAALELERQDRA